MRIMTLHATNATIAFNKCNNLGGRFVVLGMVYRLVQLLLKEQTFMFYVVLNAMLILRPSHYSLRLQDI